jgi:Kef-type K+ transport system membrane component KefB
MGRRFRDDYGARPLHLLAGLTALALSAYAILELFHRAEPLEIAEWLLAAIVIHDLILLPFYSLLGALAHRGLGVGPPDRPERLAALNHLRIAVFFAVLPLFIWAPLIFRLGERRYHLDTGLTTDVYLGRWLLYTAVVCLGSALLFAVRVRRARARTDPDPPPDPNPTAATEPAG